ncbi:type II secretion system F family protein [Bordetella avium]|uniref:Pilus assembly protein n=1 Tax=Bordetella avium (strain 197N) TaxID=360910 RepID=Q2KYI9_BORA1|nr:type II secretion system F family protein [Bordetella avium]AZY49575.1 type II secretion system F family protein [Bordetella avium]AZY52971.1 type II secretion system F family protein [Bordetella avium]RIQ11967.1 type II secretion system F family protein [Bordetella avium]RIQ17725.1 type II secretion system F family protein [Bordetella avium]RIQ32382.1 type II secretion system F family protein [Bordetella avium]
MNLHVALAGFAAFCLVLGLAALLRGEAPPAPSGLSPVGRLCWSCAWRLAHRLERLLARGSRDRLTRLAWRAAWPAEVPVAWLPAQIVLAVCVALLAAGLLMLVDVQVGLILLGPCVLAGVLCPVWQLGARIRLNRVRVAADLPFLLDVMTLCLEAGQGMVNAMYLAARHCPPGLLTTALRQALNEMRAGRSQREALLAMAARLDVAGVHAWVAALTQADRLGGGAGGVLRALASQLREEAFQRAEEAAMRAPVKMLFPLVTCMFPCTFLILAFPLVVDLAPAL